MLGCLLEKELINDYLNNYTSNQWCQIIPALTQLGLIYLYEFYDPNIEPAELTELVDILLSEKLYKPTNRGRQSSRDSPSKNTWREQLREPLNVFNKSCSKGRSMYSSESSMFY
jgi:hypothetical protein